MILQQLRKLLWPFALVYGIITAVRNMLYDKGILKSHSFDVPVIAVGNLSVGGTGKTPMIEYLIRLLSEDRKVATLSRGYKRETSGFVLAVPGSSAAILGDEPYQFYRKFPDVAVAVDANRKRGIENLIQMAKPDVILLDDAFQHRRIKAGFYILLTSFDSPYSEDMMLPAGNLREWKRGAKRAGAIVVTKCPPSISSDQKHQLIRRLKPPKGVPVFFSEIAYDEKITNDEYYIDVPQVRSARKTLVTGIAKPEPFIRHLASPSDTVLRFPDHHHFSEGDIGRIISAAQSNIIVTTEKDFVRLTGRISSEQLYYLPIRTQIWNPDSFNQLIRNYVG